MSTTEFLDFTKFHGAGNDYVLIDGLHRPEVIALGGVVAAAISNRHEGVGGDGLIVLGPSKSTAGVRMHMWNSDGSRGAVCGNGLRCVARFAHELGLAVTWIESDARIHPVDNAVYDEEGRMVEVRIGLGPVTISGAFELTGRYRTDSDDVETLRVVHGNVGNPHAAVFVDRGPESVDLSAIAKEVEQSGPFEDGVNVEVASIHGTPAHPRCLRQRTHERGSGETLACGSGAAFVAAVALAEGHCNPGPVRVELLGGALSIDVLDDETFAVAGPVARAFSGRYPVSDAS